MGSDGSSYDKRVHLRWAGEGLRFEGGAEGGPTVVFDGDGRHGLSAMDGLLLSLAGCMGIDIQDILTKGRVAPRELHLTVEGKRASEPPRRYVNLRLTVTTRGLPDGAEGKLDRAVQLSRETYCSVLHSLRTDVPLEIRIIRE